jgi:hypothetical protein
MQRNHEDVGAIVKNILRPIAVTNVDIAPSATCKAASDAECEFQSTAGQVACPIGQDMS